MSPKKSVPKKMDLTSMDIAEINKSKLKELFPSVFTETVNEDGELVEGIDFVKLQAELGAFGDVFETRRERYGMDWPGKKECLKLIQQPSVGTLKPCREESVNFDDTENLFIEGDNLEVLKILQKSYYGKVKMIYIDPPYNTGKEFIYPDKYAESLDTYLAYAGLVDAKGKKFSTNTPNEGRFHTKWLNMMYSRIFLCRNLLTEKGFLVVSIDDGELSNLRQLLDIVFGEENLLAVLVYDRNRKNDAKYFSVGHEYMVVYARNKQHLKDEDVVLREEKPGVNDVRDEFLRLQKQYGNDWGYVSKGLQNFYKTIEKDDPRRPVSRFSKVDEGGPYRDDGNIGWPGGGGPLYEVPHPVTGKSCKQPNGGWRFTSIQRMNEEIDKGRIVFGPDESTVPGIKRYLFEASEQVMRSVNFSYAQTAAQEFDALFDNVRVFDNPKNYRDIGQLVEYLCDKEDTVLDFFAGSGTTAHAALDTNWIAKTKRRFICVQLPEPINEKSPTGQNALKLGLNTIADIGKERIRRVSAKIEEKRVAENAKQAGALPGTTMELPEIDLGFKVLKLDKSNFNVWEGSDPAASEEELIAQLELHVEHIDPAAEPEDILYELLLKSGFMPTEKIDQLELAGKTVYSIAGGALLVCLEDEITRELIEAVVEVAPLRFICLDRGFQGNDQLKANAMQTIDSYNQNRGKDAQIVFRTV